MIREHTFVASLTPEQRAAWLDIDAQNGAATAEWTSRNIKTLAAHFPGLAPAIEAVWDHLLEATPGECDTCDALGERYSARNR